MFDPKMIGELLNAVSDPEATMSHGKRNTIGRDKVRGMIVSTIDTKDLGPETAILDKNGAHPVERYNDRVDAERGHKMWVDKIKTESKVIKLPYPGLGESEEITLEP
jgi:hypothetical protein